ncbi:ABC transporter ATP-binding protein [Desmospora profundinema]|uniref:ABC-2 type transport system ATP-binding protein n=1 Tax=Desmospora profundinema TaxID=1571184 RepID=A0ABU1IKI8_9BACL|nr:ABC transporter ATP-binding protein [Desmospora profundinema]MDR6225302.1 ABC-2 type transport system ATP-binding protein [Desmospora profundinema]
MSQEPVLSMRNLTKRIGKKTIVDGVSLDLYPGEVFGFLGPNGAGKTTTIRMLVGLMSISEGEVTIMGSSLKRDFEGAIRQVGGIVENPELYKFLSGYRNLLHYARMCDGVGRKRIDEVVRLVGLEHRIHDKVKTYSLGMRQRLGLAQALLHSPRILILDEPTNGLDPSGIREIRDHLRRLAREEGLSVMVSSHLLSEMELMCDRIGIIQNGRLIDVKPVEEFVGAQDEDIRQTSIWTLDPVERAVEVIQSFTGEEPVTTSRGMEITLDRAQIPELNIRLVEAGILVYAIEPTSKSLEDKFLEVTGGSHIA